jgi:site-specific recombinase XerD
VLLCNLCAAFLGGNRETLALQQLSHHLVFYLANQGYDLRLIQDYLGHRDPKHTVHYTRVAGSRVEGLWQRERDGGQENTACAQPTT